MSFFGNDLLRDVILWVWVSDSGFLTLNSGCESKVCGCKI